MMSFFLLFDEFSDGAGVGEVESVVRVIEDVFAYGHFSFASQPLKQEMMDSDPDKPRPEGETVFGIMFQKYVVF